MQLSENTILITGATSGIGNAFALEFLKNNNTVIICGRREDRLNTLKNEYPNIITKVCDIANAKQREDLVRWAIENYPNLNILINNAGVQYAADLHKPIDLEKLTNEVDTNFIAPIQLATLFTAHLKDKKNAAIINISSGLAFVPLAFMPVYCATKAAIHSFTMSLRYQLKDTGIKVFEIAPPAVDTELGHDRREDKSQSHGGLPISDFITEAMQAIKDDLLEAPIATAKGLRAKGEEMFPILNK